MAFSRLFTIAHEYLLAFWSWYIHITDIKQIPLDTHHFLKRVIDKEPLVKKRFILVFLLERASRGEYYNTGIEYYPMMYNNNVPCDKG